MPAYLSLWVLLEELVTHGLSRLLCRRGPGSLVPKLSSPQHFWGLTAILALWQQLGSQAQSPGTWPVLGPLNGPLVVPLGGFIYWVFEELRYFSFYLVQNTVCFTAITF